MLDFLAILHVIIAFVLIFIVLIQGGKGAELGAAFGGASQTVFGSSGGATFFTKLTTVIAVLFMVSSIILAKMSANTATQSVVPKQIEKVQEPVPVTEPGPETSKEKTEPLE